MPKPTLADKLAAERDPATIMARVRELAASFNCILEEDFRALAGITAGTAEAWRRRGTGPAYILCGTQYLYRRAAVEAFLDAQTREAGRTSTKAAL